MKSISQLWLSRIVSPSLLSPKTNKSSAKRRGAIVVLVCAMIFALIAIVAMSVDIAYMNLVKSELRSATDAAAKAASETLSRTQDVQASIDRGIAIARENLVANRPLTLTNSDFLFGKSEMNGAGAFVFQEGGIPINSIRVTGRRTSDSLSGNVGLFFGRVLGTNSFEPVETCTSTYIQRDIVLVLDRSGSMMDFNKFRDLQSAVQIFVDLLDASPVEERVGLASYSTTSTEDVQLTTDLSLISGFVNRMQFTGLTNISAGMDSGARIIDRGRDRVFVEKTMIVLTDGLQNMGRPARQAATEIAANGTTIHTITFGRDADRNAMDQVARVGKGRYYHAANGNELREIFRQMALTLSSIITE